MVADLPAGKVRWRGEEGEGALAPKTGGYATSSSIMFSLLSRLFGSDQWRRTPSTPHTHKAAPVNGMSKRLKHPSISGDVLVATVRPQSSQSGVHKWWWWSAPCGKFDLVFRWKVAWLINSIGRNCVTIFGWCDSARVSHLSTCYRNVVSEMWFHPQSGPTLYITTSLDVFFAGE